MFFNFVFNFNCTEKLIKLIKYSVLTFNFFFWPKLSLRNKWMTPKHVFNLKILKFKIKTHIMAWQTGMK